MIGIFKTLCKVVLGDVIVSNLHHALCAREALIVHPHDSRAMIFQAELADSIQALWANPAPFILLVLIKFLLAVHALILVVGRPLLEPFLMSVPEIVSSLRKLFRKFHRRVEDCVALPLHRRRAMHINRRHIYKAGVLVGL
jgi:hypothetical protein